MTISRNPKRKDKTKAGFPKNKCAMFFSCNYNFLQGITKNGKKGKKLLKRPKKKVFFFSERKRD